MLTIAEAMGQAKVKTHQTILLVANVGEEGWGDLNGARYLFKESPYRSDAEHPKVGKPEPFLNTPFAELNSSFSPDGHWLAYTSNESARPEVYVRPFSGPGGKVRISAGGGNHAIWAANKRDLYFRSPDNRIMVTGYTAAGDSFVAETPRKWSDTQTGVTQFGRDVTLATDGKRFDVFPRREATAEESGTLHVTFLFNFLDELRRKVTADK